ncbi:hypothetical protein PG984_003983 [Apiospora sp. TS-2023a]
MPQQVYRQCQACKIELGDLGVDPKSSSSSKTAAYRPVPAKRPAADAASARKRQAATLLMDLTAGRIRRKLPEARKAKGQKRDQATAVAAAAMLKQREEDIQKQKQPQSSSTKFSFGYQDFENAEENALVEQYLRDEPAELLYYQKIMRQNDPEILQLCLDMIERRMRKVKGAPPSPVSALGDDINPFSVSVSLDVADDSRDEFINSKDTGAHKNLTVAEINALLPLPPPRQCYFDWSKPAPAPDMSGHIQLVDDADPGLRETAEALDHANVGRPTPKIDLSKPAPPPVEPSWLDFDVGDEDDDLQQFIGIGDGDDDA